MGNNVNRDIQVMGIVNLTDDSFFAESRSLGPDGKPDEASLSLKISGMLSDGADILDFGACSTRPGSDSVSEEEEWRRLEPALRLLAKEYSGVNLSIDTFRPGIVEKAFDIAGPFIVNDVSGGCGRMWSLVAKLGLPYIEMHTKGTPKNMQELASYDDVTAEVKEYFRKFAAQAEGYGIRDWILDPGFGFAKTAGQNWQLLKDLGALKCPSRKLLAGISRKSFIFKPLGITPEEALAATQVVNMLALQGGADILRVHDVAETVQTVRLYRLLCQSEEAL